MANRITPSRHPSLPRGSLWVLSAPSGAGKSLLTTALIDRLAFKGISAIRPVTYTTRSPRTGEINGVHYHFVDQNEFTRMIADGEFLEHATVFGRSYGTGRNSTEDARTKGHEVILIVDWQGARSVKAACPDANTIFVLPPSLDELERRLRTRAQDSEETIRLRLSEATVDIAQHDQFDYLVVNDDLNTAIAELEALVVGQRLRRPIQQARQAQLLEQFGMSM